MTGAPLVFKKNNITKYACVGFSNKKENKKQVI